MRRRAARAVAILVSAMAGILGPGAIGAPSAAWAEGGAVQFSGPDGAARSGQRCGTPAPGAVQRQRADEAVSGFVRLNATPFAGTVTIPVWFHVVRYDDGSANVTDGRIADQMAVLNAAYLTHGYQFVLEGVQRIDNTAWSNAQFGSPEETAMKQALAVAPECTLNIYTIGDDSLLGWATFPFDHPESSFRHGVVVLSESLPGGSAVPYDEGDTATHEVGHYLGLFHTFQGSCFAPGDSVADTPYEAAPSYGCPIGADSCPSPGLDPIRNFMDYTDDACMLEFTAGQDARMDALVSAFKPTLMSGSCTADVFGLVSPANGAIVTSAPNLTWNPGIYDAFYVYTVFNYAGFGYIPFGLVVPTSSFQVPAALWDLVATGVPSAWVVVGVDVDTSQTEVSDVFVFTRQ